MTYASVKSVNMTSYKYPKFTDVYITHLVATVLCLITLAVAVLTWIFVPKWRRFRNYVKVSAFLCFPIWELTYNLLRYKIGNAEVIRLVQVYVTSVYKCWIFIMSITIYMDLVTVFNTIITRKMLKFNFLAWGLPLCLLFLNLLCDLKKWDLHIKAYSNFGFTIILLLLSLGLYVRVLYSLSVMRPHTPSFGPRLCLKLRVATLTFVMCGMPVLFTGFVTTYYEVLPGPSSMPDFVSYLQSTIYPLQNMLLCVWFFIQKTNRELWCEYFGRLIHSARGVAPTSERNRVAGQSSNNPTEIELLKIYCEA